MTLMIEIYQSSGYDHGSITTKPCLDNFILLKDNRTLIYLKNISNTSVTLLNVTLSSIIKTSLDMITDNPSKTEIDSYIAIGDYYLDNINITLLPDEYIPLLITYQEEYEVQYKSFAKLVVEWI